MSLLDFLKKRKKPFSAKTTKGKQKKEKTEISAPRETVKEEPPPKKELPKKPARIATQSVAGGEKEAGLAYDVVKKPHISEKATNLGGVNQYIFEVFSNANKNQIKRAIESFYNVDVLSVNVVKIPSKKRRLGRSTGFKKGYKKAIVKIKEGQKIEIL